MLDLPRNLTWRRRRITPLPKEEPGLTELARRMHRFDLFAPLPEALCGSVAKIVKLEHAWRRLDGRNDDGFQVAPFPG